MRLSVGHPCARWGWSPLGLLSACASGAKLGDERAELGDFLLGHGDRCYGKDAVKAPCLAQGRARRLERKPEAEVQRRFARYQGDTLLSPGVACRAMFWPFRAFPLVAAPKSFLILGVTVWDDAAGKKLNDKPHRIVVSRIAVGRNRDQFRPDAKRRRADANLSQNAVAAIERWLAKQEDWFPPKRAGRRPPETAAKRRPTAPRRARHADRAPTAWRCISRPLIAGFSRRSGLISRALR